MDCFVLRDGAAAPRFRKRLRIAYLLFCAAGRSGGQSSSGGGADVPSVGGVDASSVGGVDVSSVGGADVSSDSGGSDELAAPLTARKLTSTTFVVPLSPF